MIIHGDCLEEMRKMESNSISAIVTDPPYGLFFMGKRWDYAIPGAEYWTECLRISKPGSFLIAMGGTRTFHRLTCAIENAGYEIRDCIMWLYGSGFPKSHNHFGIDGYGTALKPSWEPCILAMKPCEGTFKQNAEKWGQAGINISDCRINTLPCQRLLDKISENEVLWEQEKYLCNTCVDLVAKKTKLEILEIAESFAIRNAGPTLIENARQFLIDLNILDIGCSDIHCRVEQREQVEGNISSNILKSGKNIMDLSQKDLLSIILTTIHMTIESRICSLCREAITSDITNQNILALKKETLNMLKEHVKKEKGSRWPSNLLLDEDAAKMLDKQSGNLKSGSCKPLMKPKNNKVYGKFAHANMKEFHVNSGGASRFFYCAKTSSSERREGNKHPTVKPLKLMEYLIKLVMPLRRGLLLDPFAGSGTTILAAMRLGFEAIGIEKEAEYCEIAKARLDNFEKIGIVSENDQYELFAQAG